MPCAKAKMWRARFLAHGITKTHVEVWHEDGSRRGDEEWEEHLAAHLGNSSVRWIQVNGWATTINWKRVLQPAYASAVAGFRRRATEAAREATAAAATDDGWRGAGRAARFAARLARRLEARGRGPHPREAVADAVGVRVHRADDDGFACAGTSARVTPEFGRPRANVERAPLARASWIFDGFIVLFPAPYL